MAAPRPGGGLAAQLVRLSRRVGADRALVLHGGGNTSCKIGAGGLGPPRVLLVKGSGRDLASARRRDFAALDLAALLAALDRGDEPLEAALAAAALDPDAPRASVETPTHAVLPGRFVVHTHAEAALALTNQPDGADLAERALGAHFASLPNLPSGWPLAVAAGAALAVDPALEGIVVRRHGLFVWADTADDAAARMFGAAARCVAELERRGGRLSGFGRPSADEERRARRAAAARAPWIAARFAESFGRPFAACARASADLLALLDAPGAAELHARGAVTPDDVVRTLNRPLFFDAGPRAGRAERFRAALLGFARGEEERAARLGADRPLAAAVAGQPPRVVCVPGVGLFGCAPDARQAAAAADLAARALRVRAAAEAVGRFAPLADDEAFAAETWAPERAKLDDPLAR